MERLARQVEESCSLSEWLRGINLRPFTHLTRDDVRERALKKMLPVLRGTQQRSRQVSPAAAPCR